eukprot:185309-Pyramimonas_sp.AAC.1
MDCLVSAESLVVQAACVLVEGCCSARPGGPCQAVRGARAARALAAGRRRRGRERALVCGARGSRARGAR